jgi:hypothetical protein
VSLLNQVSPPAIPYAPEEYNRPVQDQRDNVLRIYFNRLSSIVNTVVGTNGGQYIEVPFGFFFNTTDQTISLANTAYPVDYTQTYLANGMELQNGSEIKVLIAGIYNFQFSGQLVSTNASTKQIYLWIKRNNVDVGYSTHQYTLSGSNTHLEVSWNFNIDLQANDFLELEWAASNTNVRFESTLPTTPHPGIPSAVMAVSFVSTLPPTIPIPPVTPPAGTVSIVGAAPTVT